MIHVSVSVANNFVHSSTAADRVHHAFGELARFVYCLLQEIEKSSSLPLVEQWEEYFEPNRSLSPAIDEKDFLSGTGVMAALDNVGSHYLRTEFHRDVRRFVEEFVNCILLTVDSRSVIGQGWRRAGQEGAKLKHASLSTNPLCRTAATREVVYEEPPWRSWRPLVLFCTGWFPRSSAPV